MVSIRQIHPVFVGEVSGVDLRQPLTRDEVAAIEAGMDRYAVLIFHDQNITDDQQMAFTQNFGDIENAKGGNITKDHEYRLKKGMVDVSNPDKDGKPFARDDRRRMFNLGNRLKHRTLLVTRPAAQLAPDDHQDAGKAAEAGQRAIQKSHTRIG